MLIPGFLDSHKYLILNPGDNSYKKYKNTVIFRKFENLDFRISKLIGFKPMVKPNKQRYKTKTMHFLTNKQGCTNCTKRSIGLT